MPHPGGSAAPHEDAFARLSRLAWEHASLVLRRWQVSAVWLAGPAMQADEEAVRVKINSAAMTGIRRMGKG